MELTNQQVNKFVALHKPYGGLGNLSESQIRILAQGIANFYINLFQIYSNENAKSNAKQN
jgi:hypothetical protein